MKQLTCACRSLLETRITFGGSPIATKRTENQKTMLQDRQHYIITRMTTSHFSGFCNTENKVTVEPINISTKQ